MRLPYKAGVVRVSSPYGERVIEGECELHRGIDLVGTEDVVVAVAGGVVKRSHIVLDYTNRTWEWGNYVSILGDDGHTVYYCHLAKRLVKEGQRVIAGEPIGIQGDTGYSFGVHLHLEVRGPSHLSVNPTPWIGLPNETGAAAVVGQPIDYASFVCQKCGLEEQTKRYLNEYKYASDLWRKLWLAIEGAR